MIPFRMPDRYDSATLISGGCRKLLFALVLVALLTGVAPAQSESKKSTRNLDQLRQEEKQDYFKKWLEEDVPYIISKEERDVFLKLKTDEEKEHFIEQFWFRRDPDPRTAVNEFKDEYYRRIAYVNENFGSGIPGWKTDRGRIYITFGPPDLIEDHPSGGWYYRPANEGGGATSTYPFQIWTYNYLEGVGDQIEIQFVDSSWSGEYHMALEPWEKDALLHVGFMGPTDAELEGRLSKLDRPYFSPGNYRNTLMQRKLGMTSKDKPFEKLIRFYELQQPPPIKYKDLKQLVTTRVTYDQIPFRLDHHYLIVDAEKLLVTVTLEFENRNLTFSTPTGGILSGRLDIYGVIQNLSGRIVKEFDDALALEFPAQERDVRLQRKSAFQKMLLLPPGRYKLTLAVKDEKSGRVGILKTGLILPRPRPHDHLDASSIFLARTLQFVDAPLKEPLPFILGDFKVVPSVSHSFNKKDDMGLYLQIYNADVDQSSLEPQIDVKYEILKEGRIVKSYLDPKKNSILNYGDRVLLLQAFHLNDLVPGRYTLKVDVSDKIGKKDLVRVIDFKVTG